MPQTNISSVLTSHAKNTDGGTEGEIEFKDDEVMYVTMSSIKNTY